MTPGTTLKLLAQRFPEKCILPEIFFASIKRGDRIFVGTACGEPRGLVKELVSYVDTHPNAFFDAEILHVWTRGVAPYTNPKFKSNFRINSFYVGKSTRDSVNQGLADYTPVFSSKLPQMMRSGLMDVDVALVQVSVPDENGWMSLGISVDIVKAAVETAETVIVQVNPCMPHTGGDSLVHVDQVDYMLPLKEPLLETSNQPVQEAADQIGANVARLVADGSTLQVGYGRVPNAVLKHLLNRKHLGVHSELFSEGLVKLIECGAIDNRCKTVDKGVSVASFCTGSAATYRFLDHNPKVAFKDVAYTNDLRVIANQDNMVAINTTLQIDLTGQASAESLGKTFYSGIGGQADFMRGAALSRGGKAVLALPSTAQTPEGEVSRIVPFLTEGAGVTLNRGDVHYVVTEYGIAYLQGRSVRERAMLLIGVAHPRFRKKLIDQARELNLIYSDQAFLPGKRGQVPSGLEFLRTTRTGIALRMRPVRISDEPLLRDFFNSLSDQSLYRRFMSIRRSIPHERLQDFVVIDYTREMVLLAFEDGKKLTKILGVAQYGINQDKHTAEVSFAVRDSHHGRGIGTVLVRQIVLMGKQKGFLGLVASVLAENRAMLRIFKKHRFETIGLPDHGEEELRLTFRPSR